MKISFWTAALAGACLAGPAAAQTVVVPNINTTTNAPSFNRFPWDWGDMRYQQLYAADQFAGLSGVVDTFAYRVDQNVGDAFTSDPIDVQIWLGYSDINPGALTEVFDDNWSGGKTLVYDGFVTLSSADTGLFDVVIDIDNVFNYNGTDNLLMEIIITGGAITTELDSAGLGLGFPGTPYTDRVWAFGADATIGSLGGDDGLVTQFNFTTVPAPGSVMLLGALALARRGRRR